MFTEHRKYLSLNCMTDDIVHLLTTNLLILKDDPQNVLLIFNDPQ